MVLLVVGSLCFTALITYVSFDVGRSKGMGALGLMLGLCFSVVGFLIILAMPSRYLTRAEVYDAMVAATSTEGAPGWTRCDGCGRQVAARATECPYCAAVMGANVGPAMPRTRPARGKVTSDPIEQLRLEFGNIFEQVWRAASLRPQWPVEQAAALRAACIDVQGGEDPAVAVERSFATA